ncbi:MAG: L,D-transpeptidase [Alphaproteobacteria bacterium]|nr:MAG: L,D-transpeptidase [Alphaproteobacteria bacterium]
MRLVRFPFALLVVAASAAAAGAQSRYSPPPAAVLSADLASPWILQLRNRPSPDGRYAVEIARPLPPARRALPASAFTPLQADPVRRANPRAEPVSLRRQPGPARPAPRPGFDPKYEMQIVDYATAEQPGTIIVDTAARFLYLVEADGKARRYGIGVGREGFEWSGSHRITRKAEWPGWTPPKEMIAREAARGKALPAHMEGGPDNPLGARALYIGDTLYRIHGTNQPWSIGQAVSSGCIRMRNEDVIDLYERVRVGSRVVVS